MRLVVLAFAALVSLAGCGGDHPVIFGATDMGFGAECHSSDDCRRYRIDGGAGFLGCYAYLGADYCSVPCGPSNGGVDQCWAGSTCQCVDHVNAGGFSQTDCYCAR